MLFKAAHPFSREKTIKFIFLILPFIVLLSGIVYEWLAIKSITDGVFVYTLDDAYIHLNLASKIANGSYGINFGEFSAPSSSILWPFLLALFAWVPNYEIVPLILNILFALITTLIYIQYFLSLFVVLPSLDRYLCTSILASLLIFATNLIGLVFTGMEHNLQVLLIALIIFGYTIVVGGRSTPIWLAIVMILAPILRYESLTFVIPGLLLFVQKRQWKIIAIVITGLFFGLGSFSMFLKMNGLSLLPSSVLAKSTYLQQENLESAQTELKALKLVKGLKTNLFYNWIMVQGKVTLILTAALFLKALSSVSIFQKSARSIFNEENASPTNSQLGRTNIRRDEQLLTCILVLGLLGHFLLGRTNWWGRYEVYAITAAILGIFWSFRGWLLSFLKQKRFVTLSFVSILLLLIGANYITENFLRTPLAARDIFEQQYQMRRFVREWYNKPVAVNDLGLVSYENPNYVLDLVGLASQEVQQYRLSGENKNWMVDLTREHNVKLAIVYADWFEGITEEWQPVAELYLSDDITVVGGNPVTFFACHSTPGEVEELRRMLTNFKSTLPSGVALQILNDDAAISIEK